jgi:SulP family sulfate permease
VASQWQAYRAARGTVSFAATLVSAAALGLILAVRRFAPRLPGFLIAVVAASALVAATGLPVETIGSRFGELPSALPAPRLPEVSLERMGELVEPAFTIAFLAGIESLLCAVVADGLSGVRLRCNAELVRQGIANFA